ncbi:MAG: hypothetical protein RL338_139 [Chloroflexota bacterium]|jgi:signal peptidase I
MVIHAAKRAVGGATAVLILTVALIAGVVGVTLGLARFAGLEPVVIVSGSMAPQAETGDIILVRPHVGAVQVGQVYTFRTGSGLLTHRVVGRGQAQGELVTKGDANAVPDPFVLTEADVVADPVVIVRRVGFLLLGIETTEGRVLALVAILALGRLFSSAVAWTDDDGRPRGPRSRRPPRTRRTAGTTPRPGPAIRPPV